MLKIAKSTVFLSLAVLASTTMAQGLSGTLRDVKACEVRLTKVTRPFITYKHENLVDESADSSFADCMRRAQELLVPARQIVESKDDSIRNVYVAMRFRSQASQFSMVLYPQAQTAGIQKRERSHAIESCINNDIHWSKNLIGAC